MFHPPSLIDSGSCDDARGTLQPAWPYRSAAEPLSFLRAAPEHSVLVAAIVVLLIAAIQVGGTFVRHEVFGADASLAFTFGLGAVFAVIEELRAARFDRLTRACESHEPSVRFA